MMGSVTVYRLSIEGSGRRGFQSLDTTILFGTRDLAERAAALYVVNHPGNWIARNNGAFQNTDATWHWLIIDAIAVHGEPGLRLAALQPTVDSFFPRP